MEPRTRSWWGWGTEEDAVLGAEREELLKRVAALLPDAELTDHEPPPVTELALPEPSVTPPESLAARCWSQPADRAAHAHGKAFRDVVRNLHGQLTDVPDVVAKPRTEQELHEVLEWCTAAGHAVIPYGGGSSVVGGVEPRGLRARGAGVVTVDLEHLDSVREIDAESRAARIQAGVLGPHLEDQLRPHGLTLRHFPQSFEFSTLGGWLATRAGGHYATLRTHIDDLVESMRVLTPSGVNESLRVPGSGAGPAPDRLFLGSEGTLGIVTEAWLRVQERPSRRASASVHFEEYAAAVAATRAVVQSGLAPANCRLLDAGEAFLNAGVSVGGGVLVLGFESTGRPLESDLEYAVELCRDLGGTLPEPPRTDGGRRGDAEGSWRSAFLRMPYQRDALARHGMIVETFETACTWDRFAALHQAVTDAAYAALRRITGTGLLTCRFTHVYPDGPAPYFGLYAPGRWGSTLAQWDELKSAVSEAIHAAGGTITHHHAVGRDHRTWYERQRPEPFAAALSAAKRALDPAGVLNPGVLLPAGPARTP